MESYIYDKSHFAYLPPELLFLECNFHSDIDVKSDFSTDLLP